MEFNSHQAAVLPPSSRDHPILRQQKNWVGGFRKWQLLLTFGTVFMLTQGMGVGLQKSKNVLTYYRDGRLHHTDMGITYKLSVCRS